MVGLISRLMLIQVFVGTTAFALTTSKQAATPAPKITAKPIAKSKTVDAPASKPDLLFEGYAKIMLGDKHIGYTVQRFEFDPKKKEYSTIYYLKTAPPANDVIESLKAKSTFDLKPISYQYTELAGSQPHIVDATFTNGNMTVSELKNGKRITKAPVKIPPGTFLASFLGYLMLQQKDAAKVGNKYAYQAIAEEDANLYKGEAYIKSEETMKGLKTFKILNTYKGVQYISFMTAQGEVIATDSAAQGISTELMPNIQDATKGMSINSHQLAQLFGNVPKGQENVVAKKSPGAPLGGTSTNASALTNNDAHEQPAAPGAVPLEPVAPSKGK